MKYCDLHSDALTTKSRPQVTKETLACGGCFLQCFAAFVSSEEKYREALALADRFDAYCQENGLRKITRAGEIGSGINALFTVEDGGAIEGSLEKLDALYARGARMMTLIWNYPNEIGFPNFPDYKGLFAGRLPLSRRQTELGLTPFGVSAVERMNELGVIVDVSHGSDKLVEEVGSVSKRPFVASHSGARRICDCARNLTDGGIRLIADHGGVVGLDFCADFSGGGDTAQGQREALLKHAEAIIDAGGEDALALGSDFDGIPENPYLRTPADVPDFLEELEGAFGCRIAEKIAYGNFLRVFGEICK